MPAHYWLGGDTSDHSNIALGAELNFTTDASLCAASDSPSCSPLTEIKAAHITELRTAIDAVRTLAGRSAASYTHGTLTPQSSLIYADDVRELRSKLHEALTDLSIQTSSYTDNTIVSYADDPLNATVLKGVHLRELRTRSTSGTGTSGGSSGGLHYVLSDLQGSARTVMNNNGSSSAVMARHDYLPFGEEIGAIGGRTTGQGYNATDLNRSKYGMTERDATSGLDHTWWRKYENLGGRWTSPDPLAGRITDPQSLNHFTYAANDPVNFVDPSGLDPTSPLGLLRRITGPPNIFVAPTSYDHGDPSTIDSGNGFGSSFLGGDGMFQIEERAGIEPPQNSYDPREDFRHYAEVLSWEGRKSDCLKLTLLIYKAGQVYGGSSSPTSDIIHGLMSGLTEYTSVSSIGPQGPSDPNYRVGVFRNDAHYGGSFGDSGFAHHFQDSSNQVRHFIFYLGAGWDLGSTAANIGLYHEEHTHDPSVADVGLGQVATDLGSHFTGNYRQLAQDVWHRVCGQSSNLNLP